MAENTTLGNSNNSTVTSGVPDSRLLTNSAKLRYQLETRNIYAPNTEYPLQNQMYANNVVNSINTIIAGITPFKSFNLKNTVIGRLVTVQSPLSEIGLAMLGKQFALNSMSHLAQQTFPVIKPNALFDGNKETKLFTFHSDLRITRKERETGFGEFLNNFVDSIIYRYPKRDYPFTKYSLNSDYIKNSGRGQLEFMYVAANRNIYRPNNYPDADTTFYTFAAENKIKIIPVVSVLGGDGKNLSYGFDDKTYYNFNNMRLNPYFNIFGLDPNSVNTANSNMINSTIVTTDYSAEYAHNYDVVDRYFGMSAFNANEYAYDKDSQNLWIDNVKEFSNEVGDLLNPKLIWGRDGINEKTNNVLGQSRGNFVDVNSQITPDTTGNTFLQSNPFNIKTGLLEYTRNLIIASEGRFGDITRKVYTKDAKLVGFNGSGLWKSNTSNYATNSTTPTAGKTGVRQHSALDQYDRFAKAIRFNGNELYAGNPNSVIFKNVMPRIHPTLDEKDGKINFNNKNLMFSIENLAVRVIDNGTYGIMDDEFGSPIPICEVGPFKGRIMWFPPYNIEINEVATAKYESTVMVGRNEPMYNYQNSERSATINFTLLIDYPPQLKGIDYQGDKQRAIAEFFAFGGSGDSMIPQLGDNKPPKPPIQPFYPTTPEPPKIITSDKMYLVFPNDVPRVKSGINNTVDDVNSVVNQLWGEFEYNIKKGFISKADKSDYGLNNEIFFLTGLTEYTDSGVNRYQFSNPSVGSFDQYSAVGLKDQYGDNKLNNELHNVFNDPANRNLYSVYVYGGATTLYTELNPNDIPAGSAYNQDLGKRRADAAINLVKKRLEAMYGQQESGKIEVTYDTEISPTGSIGDTKSSTANGTIAKIGSVNAVMERSARIQIRKNNNEMPPTKPQLSSDEIQGTIAYQKDVQAEITAKREAQNAVAAGCVLNQRGVGENGILHGFQSISKNYFYPVFHSQTPEDFHKRLTFLQQCTRQGAAIRYDAEVDNNGTLRARNSVFGRQPICVLRVGDFFYTKVVLESVNVDYAETTWDMNPEGFGMQPMMAKVTLQVKIIGGQSLKGPIDALQNAVSFNYYANSTFTDKGLYELPSSVADSQEAYINGILAAEQKSLINSYNSKVTNTINKARMEQLNLSPRNKIEQ